MNFEIVVVCGKGLFKRVETFSAPLDSSGREIRKYTKLVGITSEMHKAARYHEWGSISWECGMGTTIDLANSFRPRVTG